ncbi:MAG: hypothetical protein ACI8P3_004431 [Saprospiraceae bacterium]|jgi:hypothetical protein
MLELPELKVLEALAAKKRNALVKDSFFIPRQSQDNLPSL